MTLTDLAGFFSDPQALEDMKRRAAGMAQSGARGFTTGLLGAPVDLANMAMGGAGGERPVMGSEWIGDKLSGMGLLSGRPQDTGTSLAELGGGLLSPGGAVKGAALATMAIVPKASKALTIYRGENAGNKGGNFWTQDKGFAREFTQSGRDSEIRAKKINPDKIHDVSGSVFAGDVAAMDAAMAEAKKLGKAGIKVSEGANQPPSIFLF
jgi:hypothetical protein